MSILQHAYEIESGPDPMPWKHFAKEVMGRWRSLLDRADPPTEPEIQEFLEQHPCLLPGAFCLGMKSGHYPYYASVIAQAPLPSYNYKRPDFMWLATASDIDEPVLIEIEKPEKRWWTEKGVPDAKLTQALDQITSWKAWFESPENVLAFRSYYNLAPDIWRRRTFRPSFVLVYGRREDANRTADLTAKRANMGPDNLRIITYDRLYPQPDSDQLFCIKRTDGGFAATSVPPTMTLGPGLAGARFPISEKNAAIRNNPYMSDQRKAFLLRRLPYWDKLARSGISSFTSGDEE